MAFVESHFGAVAAALIAEEPRIALMLFTEAYSDLAPQDEVLILGAIGQRGDIYGHSARAHLASRNSHATPAYAFIEPHPGQTLTYKGQPFTREEFAACFNLTLN